MASQVGSTVFLYREQMFTAFVEHTEALLRTFYEARTPLAAPRTPEDGRVLCERCGTEMFRMHAVWRCPSCGYKTDCCGW